MRLGKEIWVLLLLLLAGVAFVLWYVADRRAQQRATPPVATSPVGPVAPGKELPFVPLGGPNEAKTIDFSTGQPVVKDSPEDRAALEKGLKEIEEATRNVTFEAPKKDAPKHP